MPRWIDEIRDLWPAEALWCGRRPGLLFAGGMTVSGLERRDQAPGCHDNPGPDGLLELYRAPTAIAAMPAG
jgi:hypothetical protein